MYNNNNSYGSQGSGYPPPIPRRAMPTPNNNHIPHQQQQYNNNRHSMYTNNNTYGMSQSGGSLENSHRPTSLIDVAQSRTGPSKYPIDHLTEEELTALLEDSSKFNEFCLKLPQLSHSMTVRQEMKTANEEVARENLQKEEKIEQLRIELIRQHHELEEAQKIYQQMYERLMQTSKGNEPHALYERLLKSTRGKESESELVVEEFLGQNMDIKDFSKKFLKERTLFHSRAAKLELLKKRLNNFQ